MQVASATITREPTNYKSLGKCILRNLLNPTTLQLISQPDTTLHLTIFPSMVGENRVNNGANESSNIGPNSSGSGLVGPYLNADSLLKQPLPQLLRGTSSVETITYAPRITLHYSGPLAKWDNFQENALAFYQDARIRAELDRCANAPIYMDPAIERVNSEAMTRETIQCGAEITLSGRYFCNALAAVASIVRTLVAPAHGASANPNLLPREFAFGDSWILDKPHRVSGMEPDILLKLPIEGKDQIRLVGELKFYPTVDLESMLQDYEDGDAAAFRGILGMYTQSVDVLAPN